MNPTNPLAHFPAGFAKQNVVIRVRVERWIEINQIDARIREFFRVPQPAEIIAEVKSIHLFEQGWSGAGNSSASVSESFVIGLLPARIVREQTIMRHCEIIAEKLHKDGWGWGCCTVVATNNRVLFIIDAHRSDGRRFAGRAS